jgi:hypothetical protein
VTTLLNSVWDFGRWNTSLIWDYTATGIVGTACRVTAEIKNILEQTVSTPIQVRSYIEIDGVDVSDKCGKFRITLRGNGSASDAQFDVLDSTVSILHQQSIVSIFIGYTAADGTVYKTERFRGKPQSITATQREWGTVRSIVCYDLGYGLNTAPVISYSRNVIGSQAGITAMEYIAMELAAQGYAQAYGTFDDWTLNAVVPGRYNSAREIIYAWANGFDITNMYIDVNGLLRLRGLTDTAAGPWKFPLTCQTMQAPVDNPNRYNYVWAGSTLTGGQYRDEADILLRGQQYTNVRMCWLASNANCALYAQKYAEASMLQQYKWRTPLHAFVVPCDNVTLTLADNTTTVVRITEVTDTGDPGAGGGYWSEWTGRAVS